MLMTFKILFQKETSEGVNDAQVNALLDSTADILEDEDENED